LTEGGKGGNIQEKEGGGLQRLLVPKQAEREGSGKGGGGLKGWDPYGDGKRGYVVCAGGERSQKKK